MYVCQSQQGREDYTRGFTTRCKPVVSLKHKCKIGSASRALIIQTGGSVVIPCYYDRKYTGYKKYWCFNTNAAFNYCSILAYTKETKEKVSVIDHPDQSFFTVAMRNLQEEDTGYYWCAVEIGGKLELDKNKQLYLSVQSAPDVSVKSSRVSGHEGDHVRIQCFYSSGYRNTQLLSLYLHHIFCFTEKTTNTSQNSSVQISDDGESSFTVLMTGLTLSDSGWFSCCVGKQETLVQLTVTEAPDVFVKSSSESGHEGDDVSVQCFYSSGYKKKLKRWCRYKDRKCFREKKTDTSQSSSVQISDDGESSFTVLITGLRLSDSGWYFCSAGNLQAPVQLTVTEVDRKHTLGVDANRDKACEMENVTQCSGSEETDVTYSSVTVIPKLKCSPVLAEDQVIYSSVHK
nr:polymeric immunoglobulin receptor-like [Danio rerio]|eukprot:XP_021322082.1 polymeric immunoglobulin receptor-like [Danio rerio]